MSTETRWCRVEILSIRGDRREIAIDCPRELVRGGRELFLSRVNVSLPLGRPGSYCVLPRRPFLRGPGCTRTWRAQAPFPRASENLVDPPRGLLPRSMSPDIPDSGSWHRDIATLEPDAARTGPFSSIDRKYCRTIQPRDPTMVTMLSFLSDRCDQTWKLSSLSLTTTMIYFRYEERTRNFWKFKKFERIF